jgi:hypothetical protein
MTAEHGVAFGPPMIVDVARRPVKFDVVSPPEYNQSAFRVGLPQSRCGLSNREPLTGWCFVPAGPPPKVGGAGSSYAWLYGTDGGKALKAVDTKPFDVTKVLKTERRRDALSNSP